MLRTVQTDEKQTYRFPDPATMVRIVLNKRRATSEANGSCHRREAVATLVTALGAQTAAEYAATY